MNWSFIPSELEFYAEKTVVHSGENSSFMRRNFFETFEQSTICSDNNADKLERECQLIRAEPISC